MLKNRIISICLLTVILFSITSSNLSEAYENQNGVIEPNFYDTSQILTTLTSDPNFISIYYMDYNSKTNEPILSTKRKINSIQEVINGPKGLYIIDRGAGWIRENDKDLIGTSGIQGNGTAKISKSLESTFGHTITGNLGVGIGLKNIKLGIEYSFRRFFRETDTTTIDYSMQTEPGKNLYLKAYTTNRKTEVYKKPNNKKFLSIDTTYEPDGSWLKPISFEKNEKLDLDALIEKKERSILYSASFDENIDRPEMTKSLFKILNKQKENLFNITITDENIIRIKNIQDKQFDPTDPNSEYFKFKVLDKDGKERISVSLNGSDRPSVSKLQNLNGFLLNNGDAIRISHKDAKYGAIILSTVLFIAHGIYLESEINETIYDDLLDYFYFTVFERGLTLEPMMPTNNIIDHIKKTLYPRYKNIFENKNNNQQFNVISQSLKNDSSVNETNFNDLILNGDYEEVIKIQTDESGNPISSEKLNTDNIKKKSFTPPNDGIFVINRGEGWISSEDKNKVTASIVPPGAVSTISRSAKTQEEYLMDFNASVSFTKNLVTAALKIGAGPIIGSSNTITVGGSNAINNTKYTYMKAYALNHKLEVIMVTNGKITDKATVFKGKGHWIVPILFDIKDGLNQKKYIVNDNTKVINYDDIFDGKQIVDPDTEIINDKMHINTSDYRYSTDSVQGNKIAIPFTVNETGIYTIKNRAISYHYPRLPFGAGLGKPYTYRYAINLPIKIFEVDKDNLMHVNSLLYEQKNTNPSILLTPGTFTLLDQNKTEKLNVEFKGNDTPNNPKFDMLNNYSFNIGDYIKIYHEEPFRLKFNGHIEEPSSNVQEQTYRITENGLVRVD